MFKRFTRISFYSELLITITYLYGCYAEFPYSYTGGPYDQLSLTIRF